MINGLIAVGCYGGMFIAGLSLKWMGVPVDHPTPEDMKRFSTEYLTVFSANLVFVVAALVLGIIAIRFGCGALLRIRREKPFWHGRMRSWVGLSCGVVAVGLLIASIIFSVVQLLMKMGKTT